MCDKAEVITLPSVLNFPNLNLPEPTKNSFENMKASFCRSHTRISGVSGHAQQEVQRGRPLRRAFCMAFWGVANGLL